MAASRGKRHSTYIGRGTHHVIKCFRGQVIIRSNVYFYCVLYSECVSCCFAILLVIYCHFPTPGDTSGKGEIQTDSTAGILNSVFLM